MTLILLATSSCAISSHFDPFFRCHFKSALHSMALPVLMAINTFCKSNSCKPFKLRPLSVGPSLLFSRFNLLFSGLRLFKLSWTWDHFSLQLPILARQLLFFIKTPWKQMTIDALNWTLELKYILGYWKFRLFQ